MSQVECTLSIAIVLIRDLQDQSQDSVNQIVKWIDEVAIDDTLSLSCFTDQSKHLSEFKVALVTCLLHAKKIWVLVHLTNFK